MIEMKTKQEIILRYYREGHSQRKISETLSVGRRTVKKYITEYESAQKGLPGAEVTEKRLLMAQVLEEPRYNTGGRARQKLTARMISRIEECLEQNREKRQGGKHKQVMKKVDIWELLKKEGQEIGYTTVCNYVRDQEHRQETYIRQHYEPGRVCEFDWGEVKLELSGTRQVCQMAVFTLAKSNYRYAVLYLRQDSQSFQQSHVSFFEHLGGVPAQLVYDNMRVAVKRFVGPTEKEATAALLGMSMYYQFDFRFCNVGRGNEKGHVERSVEYVRRKAFSSQDKFEGIGAANVHLQAVLNGLNAVEQKTAGASALALLQTERPYLGACPAVAMECASWASCRIDKYSTFCVGTNRYSAPEELTGKMVDVKVFSDRVDLYHERQFLYSHERKHGRFTWTVHLGHYLLALSQKPGALRFSEALRQADRGLKNLYLRHFTDHPRMFIELLHYRKERQLEVAQIQQAIDKLLVLGSREITLDKIRVVLENTPHEAQRVPGGIIEKQSLEQLKELAGLMHFN